jgi:hypothetical protein
MKLYNLYQEVIFEETQKQLKLLTEAVSNEVIKKAIEDRYDVRITYRDYDDGTPPSKRYLQVYVLGKTKSGNQAIRAYQLFGESVKSKQGGWKTFRTDRIESFELTKKRWWNPISDYIQNIPPYNQLGDDSFISIDAQVDPSQFNRQRSTIPKQVKQPEQPLVLRTPKEPEQEPDKEISKPITGKRYAEPGNRPDRVRKSKNPESPVVNVASGKTRPIGAPVKPEEPEIGNKEEEL